MATQRVLQWCCYLVLYAFAVVFVGVPPFTSEVVTEIVVEAERREEAGVQSGVREEKGEVIAEIGGRGWVKAPRGKRKAATVEIEEDVVEAEVQRRMWDQAGVETNGDTVVIVTSWVQDEISVLADGQTVEMIGMVKRLDHLFLGSTFAKMFYS